MIGSTLIDDNRTYSPKTNGSAQKIEKSAANENGKNRRPSMAGKALSHLKRSFNIKSGKTTPRKWMIKKSVTYMVTYSMFIYPTFNIQLTNYNYIIVSLIMSKSRVNHT